MNLNVIDFISYNYISLILLFGISLTVLLNLNPFIICLEVVLLADKPLKKLLIILPAAVNAFMMLVLPMICDFTVVVYGENNNFAYTNWRFTPYVVTAFYLVLWVVLTFTYFRQYKDRRSIVAVFIVAATLLTMYLESQNILTNYLDEITLIDIYLYYFYLSTVYQRKINEEVLQKVSSARKLFIKKQEYGIF